jgi:hypothetical protein
VKLDLSPTDSSEHRGVGLGLAAEPSRIPIT